MARVFAGMVLGFLMFGLVVVEAYALRLTPEVVNCDRGRQSVEVRVSEAYGDSYEGVLRREVGVCSVWYHVGD